jgi:putative ABC transport system ATP-binding protein
MTGAPICSLRNVAVEVGSASEGFRLQAGALDVSAGDTLAIVSPSGSGKSLLLELLALVRRPSAAAQFVFGGGEAPLDVAELWRAGRDEAVTLQRRRRTGFLLQSGGLVPYLSVRENVALSARLSGSDPSRALGLLEVLGLGPLQDRRPPGLSGGERQRAALARALAGSPDLLLADEPTASLDPRNAEMVMGLLAALPRAGWIKAVIVATHDEPRATARGFELLRIDVKRTKGGGVGALRPRTQAGAVVGAAA